MATPRKATIAGSADVTKNLLGGDKPSSTEPKGEKTSQEGSVGPPEPSTRPEPVTVPPEDYQALADGLRAPTGTTPIPATSNTLVVPPDPQVVGTVHGSERPAPPSTLTPDQLRIRELEDQLARRNALDFENAPEVLEAPVRPTGPSGEPSGEPSGDSQGSGESGEGILIHILVDGFTALDRVWYRGQELEFEPGGRAYAGTVDRTGESWLTFDAREQMRRWGQVMFASGPWPGAGYEDDAALTAERRRNRAAPILSDRITR